MIAARIATAVLGIPPVLVVLWLGGPPFTLVAAALAAVAAFEAGQLLDPITPRPSPDSPAERRLLPSLLVSSQGRYLGIDFVKLAHWANFTKSNPKPFPDLAPGEGVKVMGSAPIAASLLVIASHFGPSTAFAILALIGCGLAGRSLFSMDRPSRWISQLAAVLYAGMPLALLVQLRARSGSPIRLDLLEAPLGSGLAWTLLLVTTVWAVDTAAFTVGRVLGRRPFWPRVSPKKTWEGTIAGLLAGPLVWLAWAAPLGIAPLVAVGAGLATAAAAIIGDLVESALKRSAGVKDSGNLLPGHGGLLDRLDSLGFATVVVYLCGQILWP